MRSMIVVGLAVVALAISVGVFFSWYFSPSEVAYRQALEISRAACDTLKTDYNWTSC